MTKLKLSGSSSQVIDIRYNKEGTNSLWSFLWDDNGEKIYSGDTVLIHNTLETKSPYESIVDLSFMGFTVDPHPSHVKLGMDQRRNLHSFCDYGFGTFEGISCVLVKEKKGKIYYPKVNDTLQCEQYIKQKTEESKRNTKRLKEKADELGIKRGEKQ